MIVSDRALHIQIPANARQQKTEATMMKFRDRQIYESGRVIENWSNPWVRSQGRTLPRLFARLRLTLRDKSPSVIDSRDSGVGFTRDREQLLKVFPSFGEVSAPLGCQTRPIEGVQAIRTDGEY